MKIVYFILASIMVLCLSCTALKKSNYKHDDDRAKYKVYFISKLIYKFKADTIWHDMIPCAMPVDIDKLASHEIDSLVNGCYLRLWEQSDKGKEYFGSRVNISLDPYCVAEECLKIYHSKDLDNLANAYAERMKKRSISEY